MMPFFWDDPSFQWESGKLSGTKTRGVLLIGTLAPEPDAIRAAVVQANGTRRELTLGTGEAPPPSAWFKLPTGEYNLLKQWERKGTQTNPRPILPTWTRCRDGFCYVDTSAWETKYRHHPCSALQLAPDLVAIRTASGARP